MVWELILAILCGVSAGTITGLLPGIHINLVASLILPILSNTLPLDPFELALGVVALAATHTIIDFVPSIFLGAPEGETVLAVLPAHRLLQQGKGYAAVLWVVSGAACGLLALVITLPILITAVPLIEGKIQLLIPFLLIAIALFMILRERNPLRALICFSAAGFLGYAALNLPIKEPLFPLLGGLFGVSSLVLNVHEKTKIPVQKQTSWKEIGLSKKDFTRTIRDVIVTGVPCATLPALGSGYAAFMASEVTNPSTTRFLMITSALNVYIMAASFVMIYTIGKARTGASAHVQAVLGELTLTHVTLLIATFILVTICAVYIALFCAKKATKYVERVPYHLISLIALIFIALMVILISGVNGFVVLATGTSLGIYAIVSGIKRMHMMGSLILPTTLYYLG